MKKKLRGKFISLVTILILGNALTCNAYSVLTHEAIIDASWEKFLVPLLKQKYPGVTDEQLKEAHAYAYGGAVAPDMGYYPRGSKLFTNLVHYVRSGDFVEALIAEAQNVNEYAFALGFLCHYNADKYGHFFGTNRGVPLEYPRMEKKFGDVVTYAENKISHKRTEFAFDVLQTARGNYASQAYHDYIGFKVSQPVLERAFRKVYGMDINSIFMDLPKAIETFRWAVKNLMPTITKAAWATRKSEILNVTPTATSKKFIYKMHKANYQHDFGKGYEKPGFGTTALGLLIRILPKVGPLKALKFKAIIPPVEKLYIQSFDSSLSHYDNELNIYALKNIQLQNIDYDTGEPTAQDEYIFADVTYCNLLLKLYENHFDSLDAPLQKNILTFYSVNGTSKFAKENPRKWRKIQHALGELKETKAVVATNN